MEHYYGIFFYRAETSGYGGHKKRRIPPLEYWRPALEETVDVARGNAFRRVILSFAFCV
jgi:hypothetical protein